MVLFEKCFHFLQNLPKSIFLRNKTRTSIRLSSIMASLGNHIHFKWVSCLARLMWSAQIHKSHLLNSLRNHSKHRTRSHLNRVERNKTTQTHWHWMQATVRRSSDGALGLTRWISRRTCRNYYHQLLMQNFKTRRGCLISRENSFSCFDHVTKTTAASLGQKAQLRKRM